MKKKHIIGLTGMSGAGKTTVCEVFSDNGFYVINCDKVARAVSEKGKPCLGELAAHFGDILNDKGELDRKALGALVFSDKEKLSRLNGIIYPYITYDVIKLIKSASEEFILLDAPTLFESEIDFICDKIVSVLCDRENSVKRIMLRDNIDEKAAVSRLDSQHSKEFYAEKSDFVIDNNGNLDLLCKKAEETALSIKNDFR